MQRPTAWSSSRIAISRARSRETSRPSRRNAEQAAKAFRLCTSSQIDIGSLLKFVGIKPVERDQPSCVDLALSATAVPAEWLTELSFRPSGIPRLDPTVQAAHSEGGMAPRGFTHSWTPDSPSQLFIPC